jgi:hypothetical protein
MGEPLTIRDAHVDSGRRWWLSRKWADGPRMAWGCCNPSLADAKKDDPSLLRMIGFSESWGFGGLILWNFYPWITPDPALARRRARQAFAAAAPSPQWREDLERNLACIESICRNADAIVLATGNAWSWFPQWTDEVMTAIRRVHRRPLFCLGLTQAGAPVHPLARGRHRVPGGTPLQEFPSPGESHPVCPPPAPVPYSAGTDDHVTKCGAPRMQAPPRSL